MSSINPRDNAAYNTSVFPSSALFSTGVSQQEQTSSQPPPQATMGLDATSTPTPLALQKEDSELESLLTEIDNKIATKYENLCKVFVQRYGDTQSRVLSHKELPDERRRVGMTCPKFTAVKVNDQYLHANRVLYSLSGGFDIIASQAPLKKDHDLFWKLVFKEESTIFDLTTEEEQDGKCRSDGFQPVTCYYPQVENETTKYDTISVTLTAADVNSMMKKYTYTVKDSTTEKTIERYWFFKWKDHQGLDVQSLDRLVSIIWDEAREEKMKPLVHCFAGLGRTGTLITALTLKEWSWSPDALPSNLSEAISRSIACLRWDRGIGCVYSEAQLKTLVNYAKHLLAQKAQAT